MWRLERHGETWLLNKENRVVLMWRKQMEIHSKTFLFYGPTQRKRSKLLAPRIILGDFFNNHVRYSQRIYLTSTTLAASEIVFQLLICCEALHRKSGRNGITFSLLLQVNEGISASTFKGFYRIRIRIGTVAFIADISLFLRPKSAMQIISETLCMEISHWLGRIWGKKHFRVRTGW